MHEPPPRAGDVAPYVEDERPATLADIRSLRTWLLVTAVWAVAATALAVFALIEANRDDDETQTRVAGELGRVQRAQNARIDDLESRIDELPTADDISNLDGRIKDVEGHAMKTALRAVAEKFPHVEFRLSANQNVREMAPPKHPSTSEQQ